VPAENVGRWQFLGDTFLAGIHDGGGWAGSLNLTNMPLFDGVAEDDAGVGHGWVVESEQVLPVFGRGMEVRREAFGQS